MSAFVVSNIASNLNMLSGEQRFIFGNNTLPEPLGSFKFDNLFTPVIGTPSITNFETRNKDLSGFRWIHTTNAGDTFGAYKLQSFINAQTTGTDILLFNQDGTVTFTSTVNIPGFAITGNLDMNNHRIVNLSDPVNAQDATTKSFVETLVGSGTITLSGAISGTGQVGTDITTTLNTVAINKLAGYPADNTLFLRGDGAWSNNFVKIGVNVDPTDTGVIQFANGAADVKVILNKDTPSNPFDLSGIGFYPTFGTLYHTPIGKSHAFFTGANGNLALEITPLTLKVGYGISTVDFRKLVFYEGIVDSNPNQTYAIGVELDNLPTNYRHLRTQVQSINDAFNWCYGINSTTSSEWMRLNNTGLNLYNKKIFNVLDPVDPQDVATKYYVDNAIDSSFGPIVSLPFEALTFNWAYASSVNPSPYELINNLSDSQESKNFKYRILTNDIGTREWNQEYTLIGNSDLNGIYQLNYKVLSSTFTPLSVVIYPFATSQNLMSIAVPLSMGGFEIRNVLNPTSAQSAATKSYVDNIAANLPSVVNVTGGTQTFLYSSNYNTSFITKNSTIPTSGNDSTIDLRLLNSTNGGYRLKHTLTSGGLFGGLGSLSLDALSSFGDVTNFINFGFSSLFAGVGFAGGVPNTTFGTATSDTIVATLSVNGGPQNVTGESSCFRVVSSDSSTKIELKNTSASGRLYELRSNSDGTFDIVDRTSTASRLKILTSGNFDINNKIITNAADPINPQDYATKNYVDLAIDSSFGPNVLLNFSGLNFNWTYASSTNPTPYQFTNTFTDSQISKNFKYRVLTNDVVTREWNQEYTLIGNSDLNGIYKINYSAVSSTFTPITIVIYPFATSQNLMTLGVPIDMGGFEIRNALNPTTAQSLATKSYVDTITSNLPSTVNVTGSTQTFSYSNALSSSIFSLVNTNSSAVTRFKAGTSTDSVELGYDGNNGYSYINWSQFSNDRLAFRVNGTGIAAFLSTGLFGFGTITPTVAKVQINGGVQNITGEETAIRAISSLNNVKIELQSTAVGGKLYELRSSSTGAFDITDRTGSSTRYTIDTNGNHIFSNTIYGRRVSGLMTMQGNVVGTTVVTANVFVKVAGTTVASNLNGVSSPVSNRLTHIATNSIIAYVNVSFTANHNGGGGEETTFALYKNGAQLPNTINSSQQLNNLQTISITTSVSMNTNDYIELWCTSSNNGRVITVKHLMFNYTTT